MAVMDQLLMAGANTEAKSRVRRGRGIGKGSRFRTQVVMSSSFLVYFCFSEKLWGRSGFLVVWE